MYLIFKLKIVCVWYGDILVDIVVGYGWGLNI